MKIYNPPRPPKCPTCDLPISSGGYKAQICQCPDRPRNRGGKYGHLTLEEIEKVKQAEAQHPIIENYVPFTVKHVLSKTEIPKDETELIQFCQALVEQIIPKLEATHEN